MDASLPFRRSEQRRRHRPSRPDPSFAEDVDSRIQARVRRIVDFGLKLANRYARDTPVVAPMDFALIRYCFCVRFGAPVLARRRGDSLWRPRKASDPPSRPVICRRSFRLSTRVANHEEAEAEPPARQVRPSRPPPGHQPRLAPAPPHPDAVGPVRGGPGRAARADHPAQVLCPGVAGGGGWNGTTGTTTSRST